MPDEPKAQQSPVTDTPESPMPSEEQKTPEVQQEAVPSQETEQEEQPQQVETEGLPQGTKERTQQEFERLRDRLREERTKREYYQSLLGNQRQPKVEEPVLSPIYDPETGLLNDQAIAERDRLTLEAQERAKRAEEMASNIIREQENRETFSAYPELNPETKGFNKQFHALTRSVALDSMLNPEDYGGKQLSFKEAADLAKKLSGLSVEEAKKQGAKEALEQLTPKEQASLEATGSPSRRTQVQTNLEDLKKRSRKGDLDAVIERLRRIEPSG